MNAAPVHERHGRGALALLADCALLERVTEEDGPSARTRLEEALGLDLARFLVGALARVETRQAAA